MSDRIFISYRREDTSGHAGRLHDRLVKDFNRDLLFIDVDSIPLGVNFARSLQEAVASCSVLLAVIGPKWLDAKDSSNRRRLDDQNDYVRLEIEAALQRNIPVIPIFIAGPEIPDPERLPENLRELSMRNGLRLHDTSFHTDLDKLVQALHTHLKISRTSNFRMNLWIRGTLAVLTGFLLFLCSGFLYNSDLPREVKEILPPALALFSIWYALRILKRYA